MNSFKQSKETVGRTLKHGADLTGNKWQHPHWQPSSGTIFLSSLLPHRWDDTQKQVIFLISFVYLSELCSLCSLWAEFLFQPPLFSHSCWSLAHSPSTKAQPIALNWSMILCDSPLIDQSHSSQVHGFADCYCRWVTNDWKPEDCLENTTIDSNAKNQWHASGKQPVLDQSAVAHWWVMVSIHFHLPPRNSWLQRCLAIWSSRLENYLHIIIICPPKSLHRDGHGQLPSLFITDNKSHFHLHSGLQWP